MMAAGRHSRPLANEYPPLFFSLTVLEPASLTLDDLPRCVQQLEDHLDPTTIPAIVARSLTLPCALEYILSVIADSSYNLLSNWILDQFPSSLTQYFEPCLSASSLTHLATSLNSPDITALLRLSGMTSPSSSVTNATAVLTELASFIENMATSKSGDAPKASSGTKRHRKSKVVRRALPGVNEKPFKDYGVPVPKDAEEADALIASALKSQHALLKELLVLIRCPQLRSKLRDNYLAHGLDSYPASDPGLNLTQTVPQQLSAYDTPGLYNLRAHLTFPAPEDFGKWRIMLTGRAAKDIGNLRRDGSNLYGAVVQKLRELSQGHFSLTNHKKISHDSPVLVFEARLPGDPRLIYQIDCVREAKNDTPRQVLLVYGIWDHKGVSRTPWNKYGKQQARRGPEYVRACRRRSQARVSGTDIFDPDEFPDMKVSLDMVHSLPDADHAPDAPLSKEEARELHSLLVLGQHAFLSQNFLDGLSKEDDMAQIYQLSDRERDVVEHTNSCFVLGRSGTGKTTSILFKIFGIERAWEHLAHSQAPRPRQLFVTKSSLLAKKVEQEFIAFIKYDTMAAHAPRHFVQRIARAERLDTDALFSNEDLGQWRSGLPNRYSELTDEHFPLFLAYHELCTMLENDLKAREVERTTSGRSSVYITDKIVDFDTFKEYYWSRLPADLTRQTVPSVAYGEFVGVCGGSEETLSSDGKPLSRSQYEKRRVQHIEYAHFEAYLRLKTERRERDAAERAHELLRRLNSGTFPGRRIDYLYVDEVQDNILVEISLLRRVCRNPNGLFWAGDTAQTISLGSAFRFADLRAFLYRFEETLVTSQLTVKPEFFQLAINYRSPAGVVNCARSVVDLLKHFPRAIDNLDREEGIVQEMRPLFIRRDAKTVAREFFQVGPDGLSTVALGHNQCILVRDEAARTRLKQSLNLGNVGIILTIYDSKGLEFDDIILYDFFADSSVNANLWRHLFQEHGDIQGPDVKRYDIEDRRHSPLVVELKHLYVAITRTRRNLWILETSNNDCSEPMKNYWARRELIEDGNPNITISAFSEASATSDWARTAAQLFTHHNYEEAALAFERAGEERRARLAAAFSAKQNAGGTHDGQRRRDAYETAASKLVACVAEASVENEKKGILMTLAECYEELGDPDRAAEARYKAGVVVSTAPDLDGKARALDDFTHKVNPLQALYMHITTPPPIVTRCNAIGTPLAAFDLEPQFPPPLRRSPASSPRVAARWQRVAVLD